MADDSQRFETLGSAAGGKLKSLVERIERLEEDKAAVASDLKEVYAEAKGEGFDTKILRKVVRLRKQDTAKRQEEETLIDLYVAAIGGQENAFTSSDYTGFFQRVPREHLKEMMALEADRITGLVLTDEVVRPELNVVLEEQNMRVANNPNSRLAEQIDAALYLNHPYGRPVIGWRPEIEQLTRDEALAFYRRFYTPNNAVVIVAGAVMPSGASSRTRAATGACEPRERR